MTVVTTWVNGWATSDRYQEPIAHACYFSCVAKSDRLQYCVQCPHLHTLCNLFNRALGSAKPLVRIGMLGPQLYTLCLVGPWVVPTHQLQLGSWSQPQNASGICVVSWVATRHASCHPQRWLWTYKWFGPVQLPKLSSMECSCWSLQCGSEGACGWPLQVLADSIHEFSKQQLMGIWGHA